MAGKSVRCSLAIGIVVLVALTSQVALSAGPGFGSLKKKKIVLQVRQPGAVRLANATFAVKGKAANPEYAAALTSLNSALESELLSNEKSLIRKTPADAEWVVELTITGYSTPTSTKRTDTIKGTSISYERWTGSLAVAYQVMDKQGRGHAAENVKYAYDQEFQNGVAQGSSKLFGLPGLGGKPKNEPAPRTPDDVKQLIVGNVVAQIAAQLGNTAVPAERQVAGGDGPMDRSATFIEQKLWSRAIEELEKASAFPKGEDESYRQYNLGLAHEAMSYESKTYADQRANLLSAQEHYDKAIELNPDQKYFVEVIARTKESVARYRELDAQTAAAPKKPVKLETRSAAVTPATTLAPTATSGSAKALTVHDVIEMHTGGVPIPQITELIRSSPVEFVLDKDTVLIITKAKLPVQLQNELRKKVNLPPLGQTATTPRPAAPRALTAPGATPATAPKTVKP